MAPLRFGIIGTNFISDWFARACLRTGGRAEASAVLSRRRGTGEEFARTHAIGQVTTDLDALVDAVDAVYVASPNALHHPQAMRAIAAGRHVLVEKVMGTSLAEVDDILDGAARQGVVAMEATRSLHTPAQQVLRDALPAVGTVRQVRFAKSQYSSRYDRFRAGEVLNAFDPRLGNSALADIGVYTLQPALDLFGAPESATGTSVALDDGFEAVGSMVLGYPGMVVDLSWSKITQGVAPSTILGEDGAITVDDISEPSSIVLQPRAGEPRTLFDDTAGDAPEAPTEPAATMHHEILAFCDQVDAGAADPHFSEVTRRSRALMDDHLGRIGADAG